MSKIEAVSVRNFPVGMFIRQHDAMHTSNQRDLRGQTPRIQALAIKHMPGAHNIVRRGAIVGLARGFDYEVNRVVEIRARWTEPMSVYTANGHHAVKQVVHEQNLGIRVDVVR